MKIDSNTAKKVMDLLSNPEMLNKISALASNISGSSGNSGSSDASGALNGPIYSDNSNAGSSSEASPVYSSATTQPSWNEDISNSKANVLLALKPLLKEEKKGKVDAVVKALTVASAISKLKGGKNNV